MKFWNKEYLLVQLVCKKQQKTKWFHWLSLNVSEVQACDKNQDDENHFHCYNARRHISMISWYDHIISFSISPKTNGQEPLTFAGNDKAHKPDMRWPNTDLSPQHAGKHRKKPCSLTLKCFTWNSWIAFKCRFLWIIQSCKLLQNSHSSTVFRSSPSFFKLETGAWRYKALIRVQP